MRPAPLLAAALAGALLATAAQAAGPPPPPAPAAPNAPPSVTDVRCMVVSGVLAQSDDPGVQSLGRAGLFYFSGRLEGRGDGDNLAPRVADAYAKMTADDVKAEIPTCSAMFTAVTQTLQQIASSFPSTAASPAPPAAEPPAH
jgi:hypothetical protein